MRKPFLLLCLSAMALAAACSKEKDVEPPAELVERGFDDGHRQFVGPVVGASGEQIETPGAPRSGH